MAQIMAEEVVVVGVVAGITVAVVATKEIATLVAVSTRASGGFSTSRIANGWFHPG